MTISGQGVASVASCMTGDLRRHYQNYSELISVRKHNLFCEGQGVTVEWWVVVVMGEVRKFHSLTFSAAVFRSSAEIGG